MNSDVRALLSPGTAAAEVGRFGAGARPATRGQGARAPGIRDVQQCDGGEEHARHARHLVVERQARLPHEIERRDGRRRRRRRRPHRPATTCSRSTLARRELGLSHRAGRPPATAARGWIQLAVSRRSPAGRQRAAVVHVEGGEQSGSRNNGRQQPEGAQVTLAKVGVDGGRSCRLPARSQHHDRPHDERERRERVHHWIAVGEVPRR